MTYHILDTSLGTGSYCAPLESSQVWEIQANKAKLYVTALQFIELIYDGNSKSILSGLTKKIIYAPKGRIKLKFVRKSSLEDAKKIGMSLMPGFNVTWHFSENQQPFYNSKKTGPLTHQFIR